MQNKLEDYLKKLGDENWRNISNSVVYISCPEKLEILKKAGFEIDSRNKGCIAMCFIDHNEGLSFYVIAAAHIRDANIFVSPENKSSSLILRAVDLQDCLYLNQEYIDIDLSRYYSYAAVLMKEYEEPFEEAVAIRDISELDDFRKPFFPDDVEVLLIGKDFGQERVFVRAERYGENCLYGKLLQEPKNKTSLCKDEEIDFVLVEREGKASTIHVIK